MVENGEVQEEEEDDDVEALPAMVAVVAMA